MIGRVARESVPEWSLLRTYRGGSRPDAWDIYRDCFAVEVPLAVTLPELVRAFYTSMPFRLERWIIARIGLPSTDAEVLELARGTRDRFAAWTVAARTGDQILLADIRDRTRSWLAVTPDGAQASPRTCLRFGSGIASELDARSGRRALGRGFRALMGFHLAYSRVLLAAAAEGISATRRVRSAPSSS